MRKTTRWIKRILSMGILIPVMYNVRAQAPMESAADSGIRFVAGLSWHEVQAKAKAENKFIFIDCYATWCGPCKWMEQNIYPKKEAGDYFNAHFISVKLQMDKTAKDNDQVRAGYAIADSLAKQYQVNAYPTFLFLAANGQPLNKVVGSSETVVGFIQKAAPAFAPDQQYYTLLTGWRDHKTDSVYLVNALQVMLNADDAKNATLIARDVLSLFGHNKVIQWDQLAIKLQAKYPTLIKKSFAGKLDTAFIMAVSNEVNEANKTKKFERKDWQELSQKFKTMFPGYDCGQVLFAAEARYSLAHKNLEESADACVALVNNYGSKMSPVAINMYIWRCIFLSSNDPKQLRWAADKIKILLQTSPDDRDYLDSYANLMYKLGEKQEGIEWENKAIAVANKLHDGADAADLGKTLTQMEKDQPTWIGVTE